MTSEPCRCHVAMWSEKQPARLVIRDPDGNVVSTLDVTPDHTIGERPNLRLLWHTGWTAYPGSEWRDEDWTGDWEVKVFADSGTAGKR